ncbi:hypothetical protein PDUR_11475 [Paenibacillus durus]|uniref:Uncharacterized protein n=1 Tax=Paenibacillus durus TaxID=44251 RepID=A0A089HQ29_PAEDU|nr:hypothetical protein PDUR_11475 [Paenibacillus durus]
MSSISVKFFMLENDLLKFYKRELSEGTIWLTKRNWFYLGTALIGILASIVGSVRGVLQLECSWILMGVGLLFFLPLIKKLTLQKMGNRG